MNKKIFLVSTAKIPIPPSKGGAIEKLLFDIYSLSVNDFDTYLISSKKAGPFKYKIIRVKIFDNKFMNIISEFIFGVKLFKLCKKEKPAILHLNTPFNSVPIAFLKKFIKKTKIVYTSHNPSWTVPDKELGIFNVIIEYIEKYVMKKSDVVVAISNAMKKGFIEKGQILNKKIRIIYNFIDTEKFSPKYGKTWKKKHNIREFMVLYVGKLTETKGVSYLIKAIPMVIKKFPKIKFVFVGGVYYGEKGNPYKELIEKLNIKNYVCFTGPVGEDELPKIYSSADLFVLPTNREGMPLVVLESISSGTPVITTKVSGTSDIIHKNEEGVFISRKSVRDIANAILKLAGDKKKLRKMSEISRKRALFFDKNKQVKKYKELYKSLFKVYQ